MSPLRVGTGVQFREPLVLGNGARPERGPPPLAHHMVRVHEEPGTKPFVDDLLLGGGFGRWKNSSLAGIYCKSALQARVCKRSKQNENKLKNKRMKN